MWKSTLSVFLFTVVLIYFALSAYLRVFLVSSNAVHAGLILQIMTVRQLPPSESFSNLVSFESLKGIWADDLTEPDYISHNALIQFPRASKLLLILAPSTSLYPRLFVAEALSDPAKSISDSFAILISAEVPCALSLCSTVTYKTAWDLLEVSFASVRSLVLCKLPLRM